MRRPRRRRRWPVVTVVAGLVAGLAGIAGVVLWQQGWLLDSYRAAVAPCPPFTGGPPLPPPTSEPTARLAPLVPGATSVTMLAHHPSGLSFLVERSGRIWRSPDGLALPPALDLTGRVSTGDDHGFLGLAISPDARHLYGYFTDERGDSNLVAWRLTEGRPDPASERRVLWVSQAGRPAHHKGGALLFGPDGLLYLARGDGGQMADRYDDGDFCSGRLLALAPDRSRLRDVGVQAPQLVAIVERPDPELDVLSLSGGVGALLPSGAAEPLLLAAPLVPAAAPAPDGRPHRPVDPAARGAEVFATHCAVGHGDNGSGRVGPPLRDGRTVALHPDRADQVRLVAGGRGAMPAFARQLSQAELEAVVDYVRERL